MSSKNFTVLTDVTLLTCIVEHGRGEDVVQAARGAGAAGALIHSERGVGIRERMGFLGITVDAERDVVTMLVAAEHAEMVANMIYGAVDLGKPGGGLIYLTELEAAATYLRQGLRDRLQDNAS